MRSNLSLIFCLLFLVSSPFLVSCTNAELLEISFKNPDHSSSPVIEVEPALKDSVRQMGLMYRKKLETNRGMLFIFSKQEQRSFWMKNTYIPLDIIFIDSNRKVINIVEKATPLTDTSRHSEGPAQYVVEVNAGLAKTWGIVKGSTLEGELPKSLD